MGQISYTIPVAGSTLNSIADPEIATALQTILTLVNGNIDTGNLAPGVARLALTPTSAGSFSAMNGQLVLYFGTGGATITLPAAAPDALVGVMCAKNALSSAVTISTSALIWGSGVSNAGVSSIQLGTPGAYVLLHSDGTNWFVVGGQQDTGWVNLTLATNIGTVVGQYAPSARVIGSLVYLRGAFQNNTGGSVTNEATVPVSARPAAQVQFLVNSNQAPNAQEANITTGGQFSTNGAVLNGGIVWLDGLTYSLG